MINVLALSAEAVLFLLISGLATLVVAGVGYAISRLLSPGINDFMMYRGYCYLLPVMEKQVMCSHLQCHSHQRSQATFHRHCSPLSRW